MRRRNCFTLARNKRQFIEPEHDVQTAILDYCAAMRIFARRRNTGAMKIEKRFIRFSEPGAADVWGFFRNGRHFECEVKRKGEQPTEDQYRWLIECKQAGAEAFWVDSLEGFIEKVRGYL